MNSRYIYTSGLDDVSLLDYYTVLRRNVNSIIKYLESSRGFISEFDTDLSNYYNIDSFKVDNVDVTGVKSKIDSKINYLKNTVIPSMNRKISNLKTAIQNNN